MTDADENESKLAYCPEWTDPSMNPLERFERWSRDEKYGKADMATIDVMVALHEEVARLRAALAEHDPTPAGPDDIEPGTVAVVGFHFGLGPNVRLMEWTGERWLWLSPALTFVRVDMPFDRVDWFAPLGTLEELRR